MLKRGIIYILFIFLLVNVVNAHEANISWVTDNSLYEGNELRFGFKVENMQIGSETIYNVSLGSIKISFTNIEDPTSPWTHFNNSNNILWYGGTIVRPSSTYFYFNAVADLVDFNTTYTLNITTYNLTGGSDLDILTITVLNDAEFPVINILNPLNYTFVQENVTFEFNVTDNIDNNLDCELYIDNILNTSGIMINGELSNFNVNPLSQGEHEWFINCSDNANNEVKSEIRIIRIDTILPEISLINPNDGDTITPGTIIDFNISDNNLDSTWYIKGNETILFNSSYDIDTIGWGDGLVTIEVYANDSADNVNNKNYSFTLYTPSSGGGSSGGSSGGGGCSENWNCNDWSGCTNGVRTRTCTDLRDCGSINFKPLENEGCSTGGSSYTNTTGTEENTKTEEAGTKAKETGPTGAAITGIIKSNLLAAIIVLILVGLLIAAGYFFIFRKKKTTFN